MFRVFQRDSQNSLDGVSRAGRYKFSSLFFPLFSIYFSTNFMIRLVRVELSNNVEWAVLVDNDTTIRSRHLGPQEQKRTGRRRASKRARLVSLILKEQNISKIEMGQKPWD